MSFFESLKTFSGLRLDIVGLVAILGEGAVQQHAQALSLSWHRALPRLLPAPQALLIHQEVTRLPTAPGTIVGVYSGKLSTELNFFAKLLHGKNPLKEYEVELVEVREKQMMNVPPEGSQERPVIQLRHIGHLATLSVFSCCLLFVILALTIWQHDGPAMLATIWLSLASTFIGLASWCRITFEVPRKDLKALPPGDSVIYYPTQRAFRIVRCNERVERLYLQPEKLQPTFDNQLWRLVMLVSTVLLIGGLIMLTNSSNQMQAVFAGAYILLNTLYWLSSTVDFTSILWQHNFDIVHFEYTPPQTEEEDSEDQGGERNKILNVKILARSNTIDFIARPTETPSVSTPTPKVWERIRTAISFPLRVQASRNRTLHAKALQPYVSPKYTTALWKAISLTGSSHWVQIAQLAPNCSIWDKWLKVAGEHAEKYHIPASSTTTDTASTRIELPQWDYQGELKKLLEDEKNRKVADTEPQTVH